MKKEAFFSIIIPTYNRANFIKKTIESFLNQRYSNFEIIVVDDGSTDNTEDIVKSIQSDKLFYHKKENGERAKARNFGAKKANGDYLNFFDSDDIAEPFHLEKANQLVENNENVYFFALGYQWLNSSTNQIIHKVSYPQNLNKFIAKGNVFACNPVFVKKNIFLNFLFNEDRDLSGSEDYELWLRLAARYPIYFDNTITSSLIEHDERSVNEVNKEKLIKRLTLLSKYIQEDQEVVKFYQHEMKNILAENLSYISLHLAMGNYKKDSLSYLLKSIKTDISFIFRRRFLGIIKTLLLN